MNLDDLLHEYRESVATPAPVSFDELMREGARRRQRRAAVWVGFAAAACLALFWMMPREKGIKTLPVVVAAVEAPATVAAVEPIVLPVRKTAKRRPVRVLEFVELPESRLLPAPASLEMMRVQLTSSRLAAVGMLRGDVMPSALVTADVLVGDDGMARAIRVVNQE